MATNTDKEGAEIKKIFCWPSPGCMGCGFIARVKDNKIIGLRGNPEHPVNHGQVCKERFPHLIKWLEHPDQLKYPLKRIGERGENQWQRISWDQALDEIADKLKNLKARYGAETLAVTEGTYRSDIYGLRTRFLNLFGNPGNIGDPASACFGNRASLDIVLGLSPFGLMLSPEEMQTNRCFVFAGQNLSESQPVPWRAFKKLLGADPQPKLIVIDPRRTKLAEAADIWLQIRPGTDAALFLGWLNIIIGENLYDKAFVDNWTFGFDQLKQRVAEYTPERIAEITWIPVEKIIESARIYATHNPSNITLGLATDQIGLNGLRVEQARVCLQAITGNMKAQISAKSPGTDSISVDKTGIRDVMLQLEEKCTPEQRKKQIGSDRFKLMMWPAYEITNKYYKKTFGLPQCISCHNFLAHQPSIWRAIISGKPYPVKAMITWTSNPLLNAANTKMVYQALKSSNLELHVVLEHFMTPTALLADYVLPAASKFEKPMCSTSEDGLLSFLCGEQAIKPMGERRPDYEFFREMAIRLGFGEYFPWKTEAEFHDYRLKPLGITFKEAATERYVVNTDITQSLKEDTIDSQAGKPARFATPSGKLELYSNVLKELGYDPLPFYEEPPESPVRTPEVAKEYPLILITGGRWLPQYHSEHRQLGMGLREQHPDPQVEIHPETAKRLGIEEGEWAYIETLRGVIKQKAKLTTGIDPRVVNVQHGWWFPEQPAGEPWLHGLWESNANVLTIDDPDACDRIAGGYACRALLCKVYKVTTV